MSVSSSVQGNQPPVWNSDRYKEQEDWTPLAYPLLGRLFEERTTKTAGSTAASTTGSTEITIYVHPTTRKNST